MHDLRLKPYLLLTFINYAKSYFLKIWIRK